MNMAGPDFSGTTNGSGEARLKSNFSSGPWQATLSISPPGGKQTDTTVDVEVP
jgi:hypothetical protein